MICVSPSGGKKNDPQRSRRVNKNDINNIHFAIQMSFFLSLSLSLLYVLIVYICIHYK